MKRILLLLLAALFLPVAARGQIAAPPHLPRYVLHFPGNDPNTLVAYTKNVTSGTLTLTLNGLTTAPIAYNAPAAAVQAALSALSGFAGLVSVVGEDGGPWTVTVAQSVPVVSSSINLSSLVGTDSPVGAFVAYSGAHVDHGRFWDQASGTDLGSGFWWTAWVKPLSFGYLVSDGSGGAHALLWGIGPGSSSSVTGNVFNGTTSITFNGTYGIAAGEWVWAAVGWDGTNVYTYINGVCDGQTSGLSLRKTSTTSGHLYVGGSDHINAGMDLAYLAGWERQYWTFVGVKSAAVQPSRYPMTYMVAPAGYADFAAEYTSPGAAVRDISPKGYEAVADTYPAHVHPGIIKTSAESTYDDSWMTAYSALVDGSASPTANPRWITDNTCPYGQPFGSPLPKENIPVPSVPPMNCLIFDSFGRRNQTPAFQHHPSLGMTEAGSLGPRAWQVEYPDSWGILGGKAVPTGGGSNTRFSSLAWIPSVAYDQDVRVTRSITGANNRSTGLAFRVKDRQNHWIAFVSPASNNVWVYSFTNGVLSGLHTFTTGSTTWTILRLVAHGSTITPEVSADNGVTWTVDPAPLTDSVSDSSWNGAGITTGFHINSSFISSLERCDDFSVYPG